jgi:hypothetical protein
MFKVTINCKEAMGFRLDRDAYFLVQVNEHSTIAVKSRCLHRGGPLHLGCFDEQRKVVICPWHRSQNDIGRLRQLQLPSIRYGHIVEVFLNDVAAPTSISWLTTKGGLWNFKTTEIRPW